jgi:glutathione S-transferase
MLTLYFSPGSSAMATHIALYEVGVPFDAKLTALHEHKNRAPDYLAVNPEGKVPTLMIDGRPLTEVAATLWYLASRSRIPQRHRAEARVIVDVVSPCQPIMRRGPDAAWLSVRRKPRVDGRAIFDRHIIRLYCFVTTLASGPPCHRHYDRSAASGGAAPTAGQPSPVPSGNR